MRIARIAAVIAVAVSLAAQASQAAYRISAWVPPWDGNALNSMQTNGSSVNESNPVWYSMNADGSIAKNWNAENNSWRAAMITTSIVPTIQNVVNKSYNAGVVASLLATDASRNAHADAIMALVTANAVDGIDVDYESMPSSLRANFTAFLTTLAGKLHAANKKLSVTVYAKTSDRQNWDGPGAEDWPAIGGVADSVKIMAYDYHESSSGPGAVTPLDWLDQVAAYAEQAIPAQKIMIGLPWYGYDWSSGGAANVTYASATQVAKNNNVAVAHDANGEATYTYAGHTVYFQDAAAYSNKVNALIANHPRIGGFAHWAAGVEDPAIWTVIRGLSTPGSGGGGATPVTGDFAIGGPAQISVRQGSAASASYTVVPINGFNAAANVSVQSSLGGVTVNTAMVAPNGAVTLSVTTAPSTPAGTYPVTLRFTSGTLAHDQTVSVTVTSAPIGRRRAVR
jgi:spore germination protein YaaH